MCVCAHVVGICCNIAVCCKVSWLLLPLSDVMVTWPTGGVSFLFKKTVLLGNKGITTCCIISFAVLPPTNVAVSDEADEWEEVGHKNKSTITRVVSIMNLFVYRSSNVYYFSLALHFFNYMP